MPGTFPRFQLYQSNGTTPVYEFENVLDWGDAPFLDPVTYVEHTSLRGQGSIVSAGSQEPWDFTLNFMLIADNYEALVALMSALPTTIAKNTSYVLKIDLTPTTVKSLKVKRLVSIQFPITRQKKVITFQEGIITLRVDSWA